MICLSASAATSGNNAGVKDYFSNLPTDANPRTVGLRVTENYLQRPFRTNRDGCIVYPEVIAAFGAMRFAQATDNTNLEKKLIARFAPVWRPQNRHLIPPGDHVDFSVFGVVPLEIYLLDNNPQMLKLGTQIANHQWKDPLPNGLTRETRWWVDDTYMIGSLQMQAYRATHNIKYVNHITTQLTAYLKRLQRPNGLFHHGPKAPFYWARGDGWFAAALTEVLESMPQSDPQYPRMLTGYQKMMAGLRAVQAPDGLWHQLLNDPASFEETSGTGMFTYAMIEGLKHGWLDASYAQCARRGWLGLCSRINAKGNLKDICVGTMQSQNKQYYLDRPRHTGDLHGQAPLLWCAWALVKN